MHDGTFNKHEMVAGVIVLLSNVTVKGEENVNSLSNAFQMLYSLQRGLKQEDEAKNKTIEILKEQLKRATEPQQENGGDVIGGQHYDLSFGGAENEN